jgi:hypothetical protein
VSEKAPDKPAEKAPEKPPEKPKMGVPKIPEARPMAKPATVVPTTTDAKPAADAKPADAKPAAKPSAPAAKPSAPVTAKPVESKTDKDGVTKIDAKNKSRLIEPTLEAVDAIDADTLVLHMTSDVRPLAGMASYVDWRMCGHLSDLVIRGVITGAKGEVVLLPTHGRIPAGRIFVFGWGPSSSMLDGATDRIKASLEVLAKAKVQKMAVALPEPAARLVGLVDEHLVKPLGDKLACVYAPDGLVPTDKKDTRPIPAPVLS